MRCLNTYVLFVVAKTTQVVIISGFLYFLLIYIMLHKKTEAVYLCLSEDNGKLFHFKIFSVKH